MPAVAQSSTVTFARKSLRQTILNAALNAPEFRASLSEAATEIRDLAKPGATEATIEGAFESVLYAQLKEIGLKFHPEKESAIQTKRHVAKGRMDSRLGALVIEYKKPALLKSANEVEKALSQLREYLIALSQSSSTPFVGFLTNGLIVIEVRALTGAIVSETPIRKLNGGVLLDLTRHVISLALTALTPSNLIRDFCGSKTDGILFQTARVLNEILSAPQPKTLMLRLEWEEMFRLAHDDQSQQKRIAERRESLAELFSVQIVDASAEYRALFALHTAYAILLKVMAYRTVSDIYLGTTGQDYRSLATATDSYLRAFCSSLEDGEVFRDLGIINLLEGDFFSWYCDKKQWTPALANTIREIFGILARYEEADRIFEANDAPDLFRDLYQAAVPRVVRSSLGEFYTPYWLAENVLASAHPKKEWRAIDPCCGSGTFVIASIAKLRKECKAQGLGARDTLKQIITRVAAVDLNPLSVLTTRINYFIHISDLFGAKKEPLVIPVFLGDAAAVPERITVDNVECLRFELKTLKTPIKIVLPTSLVENTPKFMQLMAKYEQHIKAQKRDAAKSLLLNSIVAPERTLNVHKAVVAVTDSLMELELKGWNGIWARILSNFLTTACLGKFSVVVGNPPWIDWKNLPEGYRNRIKEMCLERGLFSGAGRTGGINLNICALISYVAMSNWLSPNGRLAFLMPKELANQASYEGWRRLGGKWKFLAFHDWSKAGHPFDPVKEDFMTFVMGRSPTPNTRSVPVTTYTRKKQSTEKSSDWKNLVEATDNLEESHGVAGQIIPESTAFAFGRDQAELDEFSLIAGSCEYIGRDGLQFYPQELLLFRYAGEGPKPGTVWLNNVQAKKAQHKIPSMRVAFETEYLHPLVTSPSIERFQHNYDGLLVALPHDAANPTKPIPSTILEHTSPLLLAHYNKYREMVESLSKANTKIHDADPGEFYGVGRIGPYSFAKVYVAFRKDTKWCAAVVASETVPWGEEKRVVFQSHAVSMCERQNREFIDEDEAHYICAIFNTSIVERYIRATSDNRSFKVRPPVFVPLYDPEDDRHVELSSLSRKAHASPDQREAARVESERLYLAICADEIFDSMIARERVQEIENGLVGLLSGDELQEELNNLLA